MRKNTTLLIFSSKNHGKEILISSGELYLKNKKRIKEIALKSCDHYFFINCVQQEWINEDVKIIEKHLIQLTS